MLVVARPSFWLVGTILLMICGSLFAAQTLRDEVANSRWQAHFLTEQARDHFFWLRSGADDHVLAAPEGPFDRRRGYTRIPTWIDTLDETGFDLTWQAGSSQRARNAAELGVFPIYSAAASTGLTVLSDDGFVLHEHRSPETTFARFDELPELLVASLLFIENRELLEPGHHTRNPAIEWRRFIHAGFALIGRRLGLTGDNFGGSTLATQLEKFRHSPGGLTVGEEEKLRQMLTASLRAYQNGANTLEHQRTIVLDYVNGVPLAASPGYGEVHGMADGLRVWFGADHEEVVHALQRLQRPSLSTELAMTRFDEQFFADAHAYRMILSLLLAHRRPSHFLVQRPNDLKRLTDTYARIMANQGVISPALRDAVLAAETPVLPQASPAVRPVFSQRKAVDAVRVSLMNALGASSLYELDRFDLYAQSTIDAQAQQGVDQFLGQLRDPDFLASQGLIGHRLLRRDAPLEELTVSFTLFERTENGSALRILADNHDQPLNINEHVKLDLGSTAKLRTLVTYLQLIAELHAELQGLPTPELVRISETARDGLRRWVAHQLRANPEVELEEILNLAMKRQYSASPDEKFFTGGGQHRFSNFENRRNHVQPVSEAFSHSVNLPFVRMMKDIADHFIWLDPERVHDVLNQPNSDERHYLLTRFADKEGSEFQAQFYRRYQGLSPEEIPAAVLTRRTLRPQSVAMVAMSFPYQTPEGLRDFVATHSAFHLDDDELERWFRRYHLAELNWQDRGFLTRIHPLELWTAAYLHENPRASFTEVLVASREVRQEVYRWLFRTRARAGQDRRIRTLLEEEAFDQIHNMWRDLGYPFDTLVPSLATSLGSSADRPLALAELVGIIVNDGLYYPEYRIEGLIAGVNTPYETRLARRPAEPERVLPVEVARVVQAALVDVVENGTARRIRNQFVDSEGRVIPIGGKTGTGDHRHKSFQGMQLIESRPVHRTATFAFFLDERFFGTLTVFVSGAAADEFRFTSALPATILYALYPSFRHLVERPPLQALEHERPGVTDPLAPLAVAAAGGSPEQVLAAVDRLRNPLPHYRPRLSRFIFWDETLSPREAGLQDDPERDRRPRWDWVDPLRPLPEDPRPQTPDIARGPIFEASLMLSADVAAWELEKQHFQ